VKSRIRRQFSTLCQLAYGRLRWADESDGMGGI
jgi:hypothetical protein